MTKGGEEALLRCQQHFGQNYHYTLQIQKWFGVPKVIIRIKGEAYNPLSDGDIDDDKLESDIKETIEVADFLANEC